MSVEAWAWVMRDAPDVKPHWVATLAGLANHAGPDGRGSYPSIKKLAWYARKSTRQVQGDIAGMLDAGLITLGDQRFTAHLPPDRRPTVYDLQMSRVREPEPEPGRRGRPRKEIPPPDDDVDVDTPGESDPDPAADPAADPDVSAGEKRGAGDCTPNSERGEAYFTPNEKRGEVERKTGRSRAQNGAKSASPKPSFEPSLNHHHQQPDNAAADPAAGDAGSVVETGKDKQNPAGELVDAISWPPRFTPDGGARAVLVRDVSALLHAGHLPEQIAAAVAELGGARSPVAVARMRLRELAAAGPTAPPAKPARPKPSTAVGQHDYEPSTHGACAALVDVDTRCGRHEYAAVHRRSTPPAQRCEHKRVAVLCPECPPAAGVPQIPRQQQGAQPAPTHA